MLKIKLTPTEHSTLPDDIKKEYKPGEGGVYMLDTDQPFEDVTGLKSALADEKRHRKEATEKVTSLTTANTELSSKVETLEASAKSPSAGEKAWKDKYEATVSEFKQKETGLTAEIRTMLVDNVATAIAGEIGTVPEILLPHIQKRLSAERDENGKFFTRVLNTDGTVSALSVKELKDEILANKAWAGILKASNATGGGASGSGNGPGGKAYAQMSESEKTALYHSDRATFDRLRNEYKSQNP